MNADINLVMNKDAPVVFQRGLVFDWSDVATQNVKYKKLTDKLLNSLPIQAQNVVWVMKGYSAVGFKSTLLDFKVRELNQGDCGCALEDWHIDVVRNPSHESRPDYHLIYTTAIGTEFMLDKIQQQVDDFTDLNLPDDPIVWQAPVDSIVQFSRFNLHRGPIVKRPCKRVLIRLTQTDVF